jgi:hypothetical protein
MYNLVYLLVLYYVVVLIATIKLKLDFFDPLVLFLISSLAISVITAVQLVKYEVVFTFSSFVFFFCCINAFVIGSLVNCRIKRKTDKLYWRSSLLINLFSILSLIFIALSIRDIILKGLSFNLSLNELRSIFFDDIDEAKELGFIAVVKGASKSIAILYTTLIPYFKNQKRKIHFYISLATLFVIFVDTALQGGRTFFAYAIILILFTYNIIKVIEGVKNPYLKNKRQVLKFFFLFLIIFLGLFGVFPALRNPHLIGAVNTFVNLHHKNAKVSESVVTFVDKHPNGNGLLALSFGSTYFSAPLVKFNYYFSEMHVHNWNKLGMYNFPIIEKVLTSSNKQHFRIREEIKVRSNIDGNDSNPWATAFRDFSIDFGILGAILTTFLSSVFIRTSYNMSFRKKDPFSIILCSLASLFSFLIPFYSPFLILGQSLFMLIVLFVFYKFIYKLMLIVISK